MSSNDFQTVLQAAKAIGVHFTTLYRWIDAGSVITVDFGGITFIPRREVERLVEKKKNQAGTKIPA